MEQYRMDLPNANDGNALSNSLTELTNLKTLALRDLTLCGELTVKNNRESSGSVANLESIDIRDVKLVSRVIIGADYLHSLKSIHLESMENLIEVSLEFGATRNHPESETYTESETEEYSEAEELSSCASQNCLERIIIDGCWALQMIAGIENLEGLKCLQISANTPFLCGCIETWQKLPSQIASTIWSPALKSSMGIESWMDIELAIPTTPYLNWCNGEDGTITRMYSRSINGTTSVNEIVLPVTVQPSAIITAMLFLQTGDGHLKDLKMPLLDGIVIHVKRGSNAVVVVAIDDEKLARCSMECMIGFL